MQSEPIHFFLINVKHQFNLAQHQRKFRVLLDLLQVAGPTPCGLCTPLEMTNIVNPKICTALSAVPEACKLQTQLSQNCPMYERFSVRLSIHTALFLKNAFSRCLCDIESWKILMLLIIRGINTTNICNRHGNRKQPRLSGSYAAMCNNKSFIH